MTAAGLALRVAGRARAVIEAIAPSVDAGRFAVKRIVGDAVAVEADVFADGYDAVACDVLHRRADVDPPTGAAPGAAAGGADGARWQRVAMTAIGDDRWRATFVVGALGRYAFTVEAWVDPFETWRRDLTKRRRAGDDLAIHFAIGAALLTAAAERAEPSAAATLRATAQALLDAQRPADARFALAQEDSLARLARRLVDPATVTRAALEQEIVVEPRLARFSAWYELFPRSLGAAPGAHGTLRDVIARLPAIAGMGFDVLYLPPIHPIGRTHRKGRDNHPHAGPGDVGSPWAIGAQEGGHEAIHPQLGTIDDLRALVAAARAAGIAVALDLALQASPDHPWVREHPEWFRHRPDGSIQYAENPPKKYQDIYPLDFDSREWPALWLAIEALVRHWLDAGVRVFRVDNPHTKPFALWEWLIRRVKATDPDTIFLSEAFTRPKVMHRLAKAGFSQSYTYFAWRNTKHELTAYATDLAGARDYFRPNFWPNTPDILPENLQIGGRAIFTIRLVLAATLAASYGIYGPAFELMEATPREPGSEEYLDSEKYALRQWDWDHEDSLAGLIALLNRIRREEPALQADASLAFHVVDNDRLIAYSKLAEDGSGAVLVIVNLDPHHPQAGWIDLPLARFGLDADRPYQMHDRLAGTRYVWQGARNYVALDPSTHPAHVLRVRPRLRREQDFDYFLP